MKQHGTDHQPGDCRGERSRSVSAMMVGMTPPKGPSSVVQPLPERLQPLVQQLAELSEHDLALVLEALAANEIELDGLAQTSLWKQWEEHGPKGPMS